MDTLTHGLLGLAVGAARRPDVKPDEGRASPTDRAVLLSCVIAADRVADAVRSLHDACELGEEDVQSEDGGPPNTGCPAITAGPLISGCPAITEGTPTESGTRLSLVQSGFKEDQKRNFGGARYGWNMMGGKLVDLLARIP